MAAIDSLLRLITFQQADTLVVASNEVPSLRRAGETLPLSMPSLGADLVETFVGEVFTGESLEQLHETGEGASTYQASDGKSYRVRGKASGDSCRLVFTTTAVPPPVPASAAHRPPATPPPTPGPAAGPPPAPPPATPGPPPATPSPTVDPGPPSLPLAAPEALRDYCLQALQIGASDIFLSSGLPARLRLRRELVEAPHLPCDDENILALFEPVLREAHHESLARTGNVDLALELADGRARFRVSLFQQSRGYAAVLRPVGSSIPSLSELHLPESFHELTRFPNGLVLVTGAAGSGKSTTLAALIEGVNCRSRRHVITLEDPIEHLYEPKRALIHQREVGVHVDSFSCGLRAALRESPDVILLGEMRDLATVAAALTAAETGHLVLTTLHCGSASTAVDRVVDVFPAEQQSQIRFQLAQVLRAVVTQILLPSRSAEQLVPAYEKLMVTDAVACQIREGRTHQIVSQIQTGRDEGMVALEVTLARLVQTGILSREQALQVANEPQHLNQLLAS